MSAPYLITGSVWPEIHPRLEIRDLYEKRKQFTLFILAWDEIRKADYEPVPARYQEIAGIHGMPYVRWPGDPYDKAVDNRGEWLGYCNHGSILFPNWHRPYIQLLEQSINQAAQGIAGKFAKKSSTKEEATEWLAAARELRFPFWDWTLPITGQEGLPEILYIPKLKLLVPGGNELEHDNILAAYTFNKTVDGFNDRLEFQEITKRKYEDQVVSYFKQWERTYRWPDSTPTDITENIEGINNELKDKEGTKGSWINLTSDVSSFFNFPVDLPSELYANAWDEFSNTTFQSGRPDKDGNLHSPYSWNAAPLEQPHNRVHLVVGGSGHMGDNDTAGFDPIFYLHHCNVDRLWAFWEHIYPDYVAGTTGYLDVDGIERRPFIQSGGTFAESTDEIVDGNTGLLPFRKGDNTYWSSQDTEFLHNDRDAATAKYYTYPDIESVSLNTDGKKLPLEEREAQRAILQKYFGLDPVQERNRVETIHQPLFSHTAKDALPEGHEPIVNYRHFVILTSLSATAFSGSYTLKVSLSIENEQVPIGAVSVLARGNSSSCGNCQRRQRAGARVRGVIVIPHEVIVRFVKQHGYNNESTETKTVISTFKQNLQASIVLPSGKVQAKTSRTPPESEDRRLPSHAVPFLQLRSANVSALQDSNYPAHDPNEPQEESPRVPYEFYDWKNHDSVGTDQWVTLSGEE